MPSGFRPPSRAPTRATATRPFDNYDLGDKYQKGFLATRVGNKDELLRGVAVLHANGIEVVQDIVLNHNDGAGSANGAGGQDPAAWEDYSTSKYKNFRYVSYATPATAETRRQLPGPQRPLRQKLAELQPQPRQQLHFRRLERGVLSGPTCSYYNGSYGQSSNATFNPAQSADYMRNKAAATG